MTLDDLYKIIQERKEKMPANSYVASLFREGKDRILQKVGEESTEVIIAAKNESKERLTSEIADLLFHALVLLVNEDIKISDILFELEKRNKRVKR